MKPGINRRGFFAAVAAGIAAIPLVRYLRPGPAKKRKIWIGHYWPTPRERAKKQEPG